VIVKAGSDCENAAVCDIHFAEEEEQGGDIPPNGLFLSRQSVSKLTLSISKLAVFF
jgi:hypothetical protein